jgi:hypothetical protein
VNGRLIGWCECAGCWLQNAYVDELLLCSSVCGDDTGADAGNDAEADAGIDVEPSCEAPTAGPTVHGGSVSEDETWTADTGPHVIPFDMTVYATLTIEPCAEVRIAAASTVTVRGSLAADGVLITADGDEPWGSIRNLGADATIWLEDTTVEGGGDPLSTSPELVGMIIVQGDQSAAPQGLLHVRNVTPASGIERTVPSMRQPLRTIRTI